ncbi:MAG: hypothetical protein KDN05_15135, partial [Verrucomicrobiae bacterium]|nr:hypothetical protein [Verrucomicrobiae bacterium]
MSPLPIYLAALSLVTSSLASATSTWDGGSGLLTFWSTPSNWAGDVAPSAGDALVFPSGVSASLRTANNNFTAGTGFASLLIEDVNYSITGNALSVTQFVQMSAGTGSSTVNPGVTLGAASVAFRSGGSRSTLVFGGGVSLAGHALSIEANPGSLQFNGGVSDSGGGGISKSGNGDATFAASTTVAATNGMNVTAGRVVMNAAFSNTLTLASGATLAGTGSVASATVSGTLAPGGTTTPSYGNLSFGTSLILATGSVTSIQLANPGNSSDSITAGGSITFQGGATLDLSLPSPMNLKVGDAFTILNKTSSGAIVGSFSNAADGASLVVGRVTFGVSYTGETGNDLVLTVSQVAASGVARVWDGGGNNDMWSNAQNWVDDVAPESGDSVSFPAGAARLFPINDFPADFTIADVSVASGAYSFSGNRFRWIGNMTFPHTDSDLTFALPILLDTTFTSGGGAILLNGSRKLTLTGALTALDSNGFLFLRNEASGGGGLRVSTAISLATVVCRNLSSTPVEWQPAGSGGVTSLILLGGNVNVLGTGTTSLASLSVGYIDPLFASAFSPFPATTLTLPAGFSFTATDAILGAGCQIAGSPGVSSGILTQNVLFKGDATFTPGAGGSMNVVAGTLQADAGVSAQIDGTLAPQSSSLLFDMAAGSTCAVGALTQLFGNSVAVVQGGGTLSIGPVTNFSRADVVGGSTLELAAPNSGSPAMDVALGGPDNTHGTGHLKGAGACHDITASVSGCTLSPGTAASPHGIIACSTLDTTSLTLNLEIAGAVPGVSMDQIQVAAAVSYQNMQLPVLDFEGGYAPQPGQELVLIAVANGAYVGGVSVPEAGAILYGQQLLFKFLGGDGNDFSIFKQTTAAPQTGPSAGLPPASLVHDSGSGTWSFGQQ